MDSREVKRCFIAPMRDGRERLKGNDKGTRAAEAHSRNLSKPQPIDAGLCQTHLSFDKNPEIAGSCQGKPWAVIVVLFSSQRSEMPNKELAQLLFYRFLVIL